jgi:hypothetical protein
MHILLNIILAFYPATLLWYSIPVKYFERLEGLGSTPTTDFFLRAFLFALLFYLSFSVIKKFLTSGYMSSRPGFVAMTLRIIFTLALALVAFYVLLGGSDIYQAPSLVHDYILTSPYTFVAMLAPLIYLFFD